MTVILFFSNISERLWCYIPTSECVNISISLWVRNQPIQLSSKTEPNNVTLLNIVKKVHQYCSNPHGKYVNCCGGKSKWPMCRPSSDSSQSLYSCCIPVTWCLWRLSLYYVCVATPTSTFQFGSGWWMTLHITHYNWY